MYIFCGRGRENIPGGLRYFFEKGVFFGNVYQKYISKGTTFKEFLVGAPYVYYLDNFIYFLKRNFTENCTLFWEVCFNAPKYSARYNTVFIIFIQNATKNEYLDKIIIQNCKKI